MTSRDFCYWLQGYFEINGTEDQLSQEQVKCISNHLSMVFKHEIDPSFGDEAKQEELNALHNNDATKSTPKPKFINPWLNDHLVRC